MNCKPSELFKAIKTLDPKRLTDNEKIALLKLFELTDDTGIRNHLAIIFLDAGYIEAAPIIRDKIFDPGLYNRNGTLVFALSQFDPLTYYLDLVKVLCTMGYEARMTAFNPVEENALLISTQTRAEALAILEQYRYILKDTSEEQYKDSNLAYVDVAYTILLND